VDLVGAVDPWRTDEVRKWLNEPELARAKRVISEARFAWWKKWVDLLSPVASIVISLLAFGLAALALYLQLINGFDEIPPHP
jgi:hypothetical protein